MEKEIYAVKVSNPAGIDSLKYFFSIENAIAEAKKWMEKKNAQYDKWAEEGGSRSYYETQKLVEDTDVLLNEWRATSTIYSIDVNPIIVNP